MYEFPVLWGVPQGMNEGSFFFVAVWAAMTVAGCVAFAAALAAERKHRPAAQVLPPAGTMVDDHLESAA